MREDLKSVDPAAQVLLKHAADLKVNTSFERAEKLLSHNLNYQ